MAERTGRVGQVLGYLGQPQKQVAHAGDGLRLQVSAS